MKIEDVQIALFDMYDMRNAMRSRRDEMMCPHESETTYGQCIEGVITLLETLETELEGETK
jgi:hypothetical protein